MGERVSFLHRLFQRSNILSGVERPRASHLEPEMRGSVPGIRTDIEGDAATLTVDLDEFGSEARPLLLDELSQASGLPVFSGTVEHGYAMRSVGSHPRCPRCNRS